MAAPNPNIRSIGNIKSKLLQPSLTSHFICGFTPPEDVIKFINNRIGAGIPSINYKSNASGDIDLITLSCSEASLPGSSLATIDIDNDYHGVSEKHAYRRLYDDRADFTFYVDSDYKIITFFENWIAFCAGENDLARQGTPTFSYRANYPKSYKTENLYITKFERDLNVEKRFLQYKFINAYPISLSSMPVSYDTSSLLKCNVSFFYSRYVISSPQSSRSSIPNPNTPGNREFDLNSASITPFSFSGLELGGGDFRLNAGALGAFGADAFGADAFGAGAFNAGAFNAGAFGAGALGAGALGAGALGAGALGAGALGAGALGAGALGALQTSGVSLQGGSPGTEVR
jgi:hypothetical protein